MPKYTLIAGGLKLGSEMFVQGAEVELSAKEADFINRRGKHLELSSVVAAIADAESKKAAAIAKAHADAAAEAPSSKPKGGTK